MPTIVTKNSSTATDVPTSSELVQGELAVNVTDKRLFTENASAAVVEIGTNPSSLTTGVLSATAVTSTGLLTAGGLAYPTADGSPSTVLATNGSGTLDFISVSGAYDLATQSEAEAGTVTTGKIFSPLRVKQAIDALATSAGADIASATAVDLTAATGNTVVITGTTTSTSLTMNAGQQMILLPSAAWPMTFHATTMNIMGGVSYTCAAGDRVYVVKDLAGVIRVSVFKQDGTAVVTGSVAVGEITGLATGVATFLATSSSANLASAVTDETGSGALVFGTSPTFVTPVLGTPASGTATNLTGLPPAGVTGTAAILGANTFTALQTQSAGADIASATAVDLTAATGNVVVITGTTTSTSFTMTKGQQMTLIAAAAWPLTFHATTMNINGGVSYTCAAGDRLYVVKDDDDVIRVSVTKQDGTAVVAVSAGPSFDAVASGTISNGDTVIINADGTVSSVAGSGATESIGADAEFESGGISWVGACYDTTADRVVICYKETTGNYINVQVGQVSGSTITFGADTAVGTQYSGYPAIAYDVTANRVVIHYVDNGSGSYAAAAVGTVTGGATNTISFGTPVVLTSAAITYPTLVYLAATSKMIFLWKLDGAPQDGQCACGTTDAASETITFGTTISFQSGAAQFLTRGSFYDPDTERVVACYQVADQDGHACLIENTTGTTLVAYTAYEFEAGATSGMGGAYDTDQNKGIITYRDDHHGYYLKAVVMTIVGGVTNSITYGTEVTAVSVNSSHINATYDETADKVVVMYSDSTNTQGSVVAGTISGTGASATSTWGTPLLVTESYLQYPTIVYDSDTGQCVLNYVDGNDSESGHSRVLTVGFTSTNLTTSNYIGISDAAYSSTATATIQIIGSVDDAQTSLTIGSTYYVSFDGSLSLTPIAGLSVTAGKALAATKLMITYS